MRQLRAALPIGEIDIGLLALGAHDFRASNVPLKRDDIGGVGLALEEHHHQMPRISLGLFAEWVLTDDALPLFWSANHEIDVQ